MGKGIAGALAVLGDDAEAQVSGNRIAFRLGEESLRREFTVKTVPLDHDEQVS